MLAAHRAYADAVRWVNRARRRKVRPATFARRASLTTLGLSFTLLGIIGLLVPARFGSPGSRPFSGGRTSLLLLAVVVACLTYLVWRRRWLIAVVDRFRDPFRGPLTDDPNFEPAADALASCPAAYRARFAAAWVWGPGLLGVLACVLSMSAAYFAVDAIIAGLQIGWQQAAYAVGFWLASIVVFTIAAPRLVVWRLSVSVHRDATGTYR